MASERNRAGSSARAARLWQDVHRIQSSLSMAIEALGQELGYRPPSASGLELGHLSRRELEILSLLREAMSAPEISRQLRVSVHTVRNHVRSIYRKLEVNSRAALMRRLG